MRYNISWYEPDLILYAEYSGKLTADELDAAMYEGIRYMETAPSKIHFIADFRAMTEIPATQITKLSGIAALLRHPKLGWTAVLGLSPAVAFWTKILSKFSGFCSSTFESPEEAAKFLHEIYLIERAEQQTGQIG